jgi:myosin-5
MLIAQVSYCILRVPLTIAVILACKLRVLLRKQAAASQIQKSYRCYIAWSSYSELRSSAIMLQTGLRVFGAYKEYNIRKQNKASIHIQVDHRFTLFYPRES